MKRRAAVLVVAVVAAFGLGLAPARAGDVWVVDVDPGTGSCHGGPADFATIQQAVTMAVSGDTIRVCPGVYHETVTVTTPGLTILGAKAGQDARGRSQQNESEVTGGVKLLADRITWDGFLLSGTAGPGMYTSPEFSGYDIRDTIFKDNGIGLHLGSSGVSDTWVRSNLFVANNEFSGKGAGNGIYASQGTVRVVIVDNRFQDHNNAGILFADHPDGSSLPQRDVLVLRNQSVGDKTFAAFYASSQVCVADNLIQAREGDPRFPAPTAGIFIGARNDHILVKHNRVTSASGNGIDVRDSAGDPALPDAPPEHIQVARNKVSGAEQHGIEVDATGVGEYQVRGNLALGNQQVGIHFGRSTHENRVEHNTARNNVVFDCQDESSGERTAGTDNTWSDNVGPDASPPGICALEHEPQPDKGHGRHRHKHKDHKHHDRRCGCSLPWRP
jgi:parallel beta-helix repeat protein